MQDASEAEQTWAASLVRARAACDSPPRMCRTAALFKSCAGITSSLSACSCSAASCVPPCHPIPIVHAMLSSDVIAACKYSNCIWHQHRGLNLHNHAQSFRMSSPPGFPGLHPRSPGHVPRHAGRGCGARAAAACAAPRAPALLPHALAPAPSCTLAGRLQWHLRLCSLPTFI